MIYMQAVRTTLDTRYLTMRAVSHNKL